MLNYYVVKNENDLYGLVFTSDKLEKFLDDKDIREEFMEEVEKMNLQNVITLLVDCGVSFLNIKDNVSFFDDMTDIEVGHVLRKLGFDVNETDYKDILYN